MQVAFMIWGILGLLGSLFMFFDLIFPLTVGVGTSAYVSAMVLIWIGGMLFFALGAILNVMNQARADVEIIRRKAEHRTHPTFVDAEQPWRST
jgi:hypothetical protein